MRDAETSMIEQVDNVRTEARIDFQNFIVEKKVTMSRYLFVPIGFVASDILESSLPIKKGATEFQK